MDQFIEVAVGLTLGGQKEKNMPMILYTIEKIVTGRPAQPRLKGPQRIGESCLVTRFSKMTDAATRKEE